MTEKEYEKVDKGRTIEYKKVITRKKMKKEQLRNDQRLFKPITDIFLSLTKQFDNNYFISSFR